MVVKFTLFNKVHKKIIKNKTTPEALIAYFKVYFKENLVPTLFFYTSTHWGL